MTLRVKNWGEFQHYRNRMPPWLKLHRKMLDDFEWHSLPDASKALAPMLWLLASEERDGIITLTNQKIAFRLRTSGELVDRALQPLIDAGFFIVEQDDIGALAPRTQDAASEREAEEETEGERDAPAREHELPDGWKPDAEDLAWAKTERPDLDQAAIVAETGRFVNHASANARTAVRWGPAWRLWISKAHAPKAAAVGKADSSTPDRDGDGQWRARLRTYRVGGWWLEGDWGPRPESGKCRAPAALLDEWRACQQEAA